MTNVIEVEHLLKIYKTKTGFHTAVRDVSFSVKKGELFGFLGPNGAGKTTTISILCTLLRPTKGSATLNGFDILKYPHAVRQSIGLVFQEPSLDERLTARENLEFHALLYNIPRILRAERIQQMLTMMELEMRQDELVRHFSGGMKRRLEIARGLLHHPKVLFLDEPTLGLDPQTRSYIWNYIQELKRKEEITLFLTTHHMDEAEHCDRIAVIDHGEIIALDTPDSLKKTLGGDMIYLTALNPKRAKEEITRRYSVQVKEDPPKGLYFEMAHGEEFIPGFIQEASFKITS
ncbi:MAG: ATP-binding cassette domain-containing protein, partial [Nitrospira sp.]|nr:ATP-binding cassette domain-containing protein [Nitrospira sp.]